MRGKPTATCPSGLPGRSGPKHKQLDNAEQPDSRLHCWYAPLMHKPHRVGSTEGQLTSGVEGS